MQSSSEERLRLQLEASTRVGRREKRSGEVAPLPGLSILWHPDPRRLGEQVALPELSAGRAVHLSRSEPGFRSLPGAPGSSPRPLADPFLSRRPLILEPRQDGGLRLHGATDRLPVEADGRPVTGELLLGPEAWRQGSLLLLAERVVLLLHLVEAVEPEPVPPLGLVGLSSTMVRLRRQILELASVSLPVLIRGETGSGKELVARALHEKSGRASGPFVAVNLAALPPSLAAAELFGARKGAFTGAGEARAGRFASAHGGTLFLDEVGETSPEVQVLLLRALESGEIQPVGSDRSRRLDVRIVAATDADLEHRIEKGDFKAPLLHRLNACTLHLPPLRRRREDVGLLLHHFLCQELSSFQAGALLEPAMTSSGDGGGGPRDPWLSARLVLRLAGYRWPGNVRELRNVARHLAVRYRHRQQIPPSAWEELGRELFGGAAEDDEGARLEPGGVEAPSGPRGYRSGSAVSDRELVRALDAHRWRVAATAAALGLSRTSLYRRMDACPEIRRASEITEQEIRSVLREQKGNVSAAASQLQVSPHGLKLRLAELASPEAPPDGP